MSFRSVSLVVLSVSLCFIATPVLQAAITFDGELTVSGYTYKAKVTFQNSGGNLVVTLSNTATERASAPGQVLTTLFFAANGETLSLTPVSAILPAGSDAYGKDVTTLIGYDRHGRPIYDTHFDRTVPWHITAVGGEWAYKADTGVNPPDPDPIYGIGSAGLGVFAPTDRFPPLTNLWGPDSVDGVQFGIIPAVDDLSSSNGGLQVPLIRNTVVFTLSGLGTAEPGDIINEVGFQYGTALDEPRVIVGGNPRPLGVPEPTGLVIWSILSGGAAGLAAMRRRRAEASGRP